MGVDRAIDITAVQRKIILALLRKHLPNTAAWVYGSRATWNARPQSDLDMVVFTTPAQERGVSDLWNAFEESALPFRVDLFVWDAVPESFHKQIEAEHVVLVEKEEWGGAGEQLFGPLPEDWEYTTLGIACHRGGGDIQTGPFGSQLHASDYVSTGIPSIMPQNIGDNRIIEDGIARISPTDARRLGRYLVRKGDIVYSRRGDVERRALIRELEGGWLCGTGCLRVRLGDNGVDPGYASYFLGHPRVREWIVRHAHGATMPNLNTSILSSCPFVIPPKKEQRAIAHILGTLDDKIELNRRMNETLEEMARALFKSWFVDFDPVHAKATLKHHAANQAPRQAASTPATEAARSGITPPLRGSRQAKGASPQARRRGEIRRLYSPQTLQKAQALRHNQTDAKSLLWHYLRNKQLGGHKFRRQQPIGPYTADFACLPQKLLIELDGSQHAARQDYDEKRDAFLREKGYRVLRFWNNEVFENCFGVLESIYAVLPHHPPLEGGSKDASFSGRGDPPPQQPAPDGLAAATPPQGGSDWTVERARAYLDGMDADIAALFPDSFVDSELGPIPVGWEVKQMEEFATVIYGAPFSSKRFNDSGLGLPLIRIRDLATHNPRVFTDERHPKGHLIKPADIVVGMDGEFRAHIWKGPRAWLNQRVCHFEPVPGIPRIFLLESLSNPLSDFERGKVGTTVIHLGKSDIDTIKLILPSKAILDMFALLSEPLSQRVIDNTAESRCLTALRDTLLPKLVSREVRVRATSNYAQRDAGTV